MREELMVEALCWELQNKVSVHYAYNHQALSYYCPEENCLTEVRPKKLKNVYFYAPSKHSHGCKNRSQETCSSLHPSHRKVIPPEKTQIMIPSLLGPGRILKNHKLPTREELSRLAIQVQFRPTICPGTFEDVITAWKSMSHPEKFKEKLTIGDKEYNYDSAFLFLACTGSDLSQLPCKNNIIFGGGNAWIYRDKIFIETLKRFKHNETKCPLLFSAPKESLNHLGLQENIRETITVFFHGDIKILPPVKDVFAIEDNFRHPYEGFIVLKGLLKP
jgi:hypothetical protein